MKTIQNSLLLFIFCFSALGSSKNLKLVTFEFPPLEFAGKGGQPQGIAVEVVKLILEKKLSHKVEISIFPWTRALKDTKKGKFDAIFTAYKNAERVKFLDYSNEVVIPQVVKFYQKKNSKWNFSGDLMELQKARIGVVSTISYGEKFDQVKDKLQLFRNTKLEYNFKQLQKDRLDLVISNIFVGAYTLKKNAMQNNFETLNVLVQKVPSYIAFSKANKLTSLRDQFDAEFRKIVKSGEYFKIMNKYNITKEMLDMK